MIERSFVEQEFSEQVNRGEMCPKRKLTNTRIFAASFRSLHEELNANNNRIVGLVTPEILDCSAVNSCLALDFL